MHRHVIRDVACRSSCCTSHFIITALPSLYILIYISFIYPSFLLSQARADGPRARRRRAGVRRQAGGGGCGGTAAAPPAARGALRAAAIPASTAATPPARIWISSIII